MKHLNSNILCAVAIRTTGPNSQKQELIEIAVIPLDPKCDVSREYLPFNLMIKPEHPERAEYDINNEYLMKVCTVGFDKYDAANMFEDWFSKLKLKSYKKIVVLAHNWVRQIDFVKEWLQPTSFEMCFHTDYRDPQVIGLYLNDIADIQNERYPFAKVKLSYMCATRRLEYAKRIVTVIDECDAVVKLYKNLIRNYSI
jgi:DNA polymerase III epsilon subunit-like protein